MKALPEKVKTYFYGALALIYVLLLIRKNTDHTYDPFLDGYGADLLAVPLILFCTSLVTKFLYGKHLVQRANLVFAVVIYISIFFEVVLPYFSVKYTADWLDIICYFTGGVIYLSLERLVGYGKSGQKLQ